MKTRDPRQQRSPDTPCRTPDVCSDQTNQVQTKLFDRYHHVRTPLAVVSDVVDTHIGVDLDDINHNFYFPLNDAV
jgi:hypothetical protein